MAKVLIATEKPFAAQAVNGIKEIIEGAGFELALLEKYTEKAQLLSAVADVDAIIIPSRNSVSVNADAIKTSAGALHTLPVCRENNIAQTIRFLKNCGIRIVGATELY